MAGFLCRTADDAFRAGFEASCEHQVSDPEDCPYCRLTDTEITRLAVLLRPHGSTQQAVRQAA